MPNTVYNLSLWARKNDGAGNTMRARISWLDNKHNEIKEDSTSALTADSAGYKFLTTGNVISPSYAVMARIKLNIWVTDSPAYWDRWDDITFGPATGVVARSVSELVSSGGMGLLPNTPNPFAGTTKIRYRLSQPSEVGLKVYNVAGQCVRTIFCGFKVAGLYEVRWDGRDERGADLAGGIYICRLTTIEGSMAMKLILSR